MDYREELAERQQGLRGLVNRIPGFKGYSEKELRREADKLLRSHLAERLQEQRNRLSELQVSLVKSRQLAAVGEIERAVTKLRRLVDRLKTASYGYAGWFDAVAVNTEELDRLYQYDHTLVSGMEETAARIDALAQAIKGKGDVEAATASVLELLDQLNEALDRRGQVLYER